MNETSFVDHYETLQLSAAADSDTVERVYRLLAKRFHPDNLSSGDSEQFNAVRRAYETLSDPERRAKYDVTYDEEKGHQWRIFDQGAAADGPEQESTDLPWGSLTALRCQTARAGGGRSRCGPSRADARGSARAS